jgi:hypothetical protein
MFLQNVGFSRLHGVISQKIKLFVTTVVKTSDSTMYNKVKEQSPPFKVVIWFLIPFRNYGSLHKTCLNMKPWVSV